LGPTEITPTGTMTVQVNGQNAVGAQPLTLDGLLWDEGQINWQDGNAPAGAPAGGNIAWTYNTAIDIQSGGSFNINAACSMTVPVRANAEIVVRGGGTFESTGNASFSDIRLINNGGAVNIGKA
jgi:hypothetical protein